MKTTTRQPVNCSHCGASLVRVIWNYGKNKPVENFFCNRSCKGIWQREQREKLGFTREWLMDQYIAKGISANEIARSIGRDPKRVWDWLINYGISTRPRGHDTSKLPKDGSPFRGHRHTQETRQIIRERRIKDGHVPYLKDGIHWLKATGRKPASWKGGITPERQALYASDEWAQVVKLVWQRADAKCERCGKDHRKVDNRSKHGFHIHHIDSFAIVDRRADINNLVLVCRPCHHWIHSIKNVTGEYLGRGH